MPVRLVTDPADVLMDASAHPWDVRLKYAVPADLLSDYRSSNAALGRQFCPVSDYLAEHLDDDLIEVEDHIYSHPEWGPPVLCESIYRTLLFNHGAAGAHGEFIARWVQHYLALTLVRHHRYENARFAVEPMLKDARMRFVSAEAAAVILAYVAQGHPNPGRFLAKPEVLDKFTGLDPSQYPSPDFDRGSP